MLKYLNQYSRYRKLWLLVAFTALILEMIALWFQYEMNIKPCILCIYERCALFGIMGACLIGYISPRKVLTRYLALTIWLYSAWEGIRISWEHATTTQLYSSPLIGCHFITNSSSWLSLDKWISHMPIVYEYENCSVFYHKLPILVAPKWLVGFFIVYFTIAFLILVIDFILKITSLKNKK